MQPEDSNTKIKDLERQIEALTKKVDDFTNPTSIPDQFLKTLSDKGFVRITETLPVSFTTTDGYDSKYLYMFSTIEDKQFVFFNINAKDFTKIRSISISGDEFTANTEGFGLNDPFTFWSTDTSPSPLVNGGTYYTRDITSTSFKLSSSVGGAAINITDIGSGTQFLQRINILF